MIWNRTPSWGVPVLVPEKALEEEDRVSRT
jgi:hypothetical protein